MHVLAHRGYWLEAAEQNTFGAFERALAAGFGIETDIRDAAGQLVISHDIPRTPVQPLERLLALYRRLQAATYLAFNIKADGLWSLLQSQLHEYGITQYFVFDMSIPDTIPYLRSGMNVFSRHSDYEKEACFYADVKGVWLDQFQSNWIGQESIAWHTNNQKSVCIVSPELHKRDYAQAWPTYRSARSSLLGTPAGDPCVMLCTDHPLAAKRFFCE